MFSTRIWKMRQHYQTALLVALLGPFGQKNGHRVTDGGFIWATGGHRGDNPTAVTQQRDMPQDMLTVFGTHPHHIFLLAFSFMGHPGCLAIEVAYISHQL